MPTSDILVPAEGLTAFSADFLRKMGCTEAVANDVAAHLVDSDLVGAKCTTSTTDFGRNYRAGGTVWGS